METVKIDEFYEESNESPIINLNFWVIPSTTPHIREFVKNVEWFAVDHLLKLEIRETPAFSVFDWFNKLPINKHNMMSENYKSDESIVICILDDNDQILTRLKFQELYLFTHKCLLDVESEFGADNDLIHQLKIRYKTVTRQNIVDETDAVDDEEWLADKNFMLDSENSVDK